MLFKETQLPGAYVIEIDKIEDRRGFFARAWCRKDFEAQGLVSSVVQCNLSFNKNPYTIRGMHYQDAPFEEVKLVRCTRGAVYDVIIDLRPQSSTYLKWIGVELTADNYRMIYAPESFAHGYLTLTEGAEVFYQVSQFYAPNHERGVRWDDPVFAIHWPIDGDVVISEKDNNWPNFIS
jgi:dTDP-4-dehydrorhamnose 3,5-epimerase